MKGSHKFDIDYVDELRVFMQDSLYQPHLPALGGSMNRLQL